MVFELSGHPPKGSIRVLCCSDFIHVFLQLGVWCVSNLVDNDNPIELHALQDQSHV